MKNTMKSLRLDKPRKFTTVISQLPDVNDGDVLIKFKYAMLCGSDHPKFNGNCPDISCPLPIGMPIHECIGEVVLSNNISFSIGDLVLSMPKNDSGLSEYFVSNANQTIKLIGWDDEDIKYAPLCQPTGTILNAIDKIHDVESKKILLFGMGGIGYIFCNILKSRGANNITVIEPNEYRRSIAKENFDINVASQWSDKFSEEFDLVIDAVGQSSQEYIFNKSIISSKSEGIVLLFGIPTIKKQTINIYGLIRKNLKVIGVINPDWKKYLKNGVTVVQDNLQLFRDMVTHEFPLSKAESAFKFFGEDNTDRIKILLYNDFI